MFRLTIEQDAFSRKVERSADSLLELADFALLVLEMALVPQDFTDAEFERELRDSALELDTTGRFDGYGIHLHMEQAADKMEAIN